MSPVASIRRSRRRVLGSPLGRAAVVLLPALVLVANLLIDVVRHAHPYPTVLLAGTLEEPAHLLTSALILAAAAGPARLLAHRGRTAIALVGSVALDVDHLPLYESNIGLAARSAPNTHSVMVVAAFLLAAAAWPRGRSVMTALAAGVALHLVRDLATGGGLTLVWPLSSAVFRVPYVLYALVLMGAAMVTTRRVHDELIRP